MKKHFKKNITLFKERNTKALKQYFYVFIPFFVLVMIIYSLYRKFNDEITNVVFINSIFFTAVLSFSDFIIGFFFLYTLKQKVAKAIKIIYLSLIFFFFLAFPYLLIQCLYLIESFFLNVKYKTFYEENKNTVIIVYLLHTSLTVGFTYIFYKFANLNSDLTYFHFFEKKMKKRILWEEVIFFMAEEGKVYLQSKEDYFTTNSSLKNICENMPSFFVQVNKKCIINTKSIHSFFVDKKDQNKYKCILKINGDEEEISIGRKWIDEFKKIYHKN